ncbi:MAG: GlsB/YeaQ/YmgE family stress response membrane protein [Planctomyces sp.]|nr:GlsB/YeaQ/YmgE family stress response membrane protein [Planctomyces sp.]
MLMNVLSWLVFGLVVGSIARFLIPGRQNMGWFLTTVLGIVGSMVGGAISWFLFGQRGDQINPAGLIMSTIGAILVVVIARRLSVAK